MTTPRDSWFRIDPIVLTHWRFKDAGLAGTGLWFLAATWCVEHSTDGHIPIAAAKGLMPGAAVAMKRVAKSGLWFDCTEHEGCVELRAFLVDEKGRPRQQSRAEAEEMRQKERDRSAIRRRDRAATGRRPGGDRAVAERSPAGREKALDTPLLQEIPPLPPHGGEPESPADAEIQTGRKRRTAALVVVTVGEFARWYDAYPRHEGKDAAARAYKSARNRGATTEELLAGAERFAADPNREAEFTAHPSTWLNQGRWKDDPLPTRTPPPELRPAPGIPVGPPRKKIL